ncbi:TetR/AcrR family transcriptional regulator [Streptomyces sp. NBC_01167]|uniref:ScbR family autoregulator-binding transcription factor n=2 Tax=unclassified Streptomyces TaxID=2593676 RepID=UPI003864BA01|nr:TetR/AcrR family transcriptional regulator [Streptomyces sp. NBC_01167]
MAVQERAVRTRNALIVSAAELFDRDGFEVASLSMISARAGVSSGALHFHFSSKAALADAVGQEAAQRLEMITRQRGDGGLQVLIDATHALVRALDRDAVLRAGFGLSDRAEHDQVGAGLRRVWQEWVEGVLVRAEGEGVLAGGPSVRDAVTAVVAVTAGLETLGRQDASWLSQTPLTRFWGLLLPRLAAASCLETLVASGTCTPTVTATASAPQ